jgi:hypothetical protein
VSHVKEPSFSPPPPVTSRPGISLPASGDQPAVDAELIAACSQLEGAYRGYETLFDERRDWSAEAEAAGEAAIHARAASVAELEDKVLSLAATTMDGLKARARAALAGATRDPEDGEIVCAHNNECLAWAVLEELVQL